MYLNLAKIRSFIAVAEHASFRRASEDLRLSQPALSTHVRDLEIELGVALLSRTTRSVRLTAAGEHFLIRAKRAISELQSVVLDLRDEVALRRGRVTIACLPTIASSSLPSVLAAFSRQHPGVHVEVLDEVADSLYQRVVNREADLGIGPAPPRKQDIEFTPIVDDHFRAVFPSDHAFARRKTVRLAELTKYPFLTLAPHTNVRSILERAFADSGFPLDPIHVFCHHYTLGGMVEAGLGITALPSMSLSILGHPRLMSARIVEPEVIRVIGVLRRRRDELSPAAAAFLNAVWEAFSKIPPNRSKSRARAKTYAREEVAR
jgi:LysR family transcriptional regulator, carnitine catabolism transcriptional activator